MRSTQVPSHKFCLMSKEFWSSRTESKVAFTLQEQFICTAVLLLHLLLTLSCKSSTLCLASPHLCSLNFPHIPNLSQQILGPRKSKISALQTSDANTDTAWTIAVILSLDQHHCLWPLSLPPVPPQRGSAPGPEELKCKCEAQPATEHRNDHSKE